MASFVALNIPVLFSCGLSFVFLCVFVTFSRSDAGPGRAIPRSKEGPLVASGRVRGATSQRLPQDEPHGGLPGRMTGYIFISYCQAMNKLLTHSSMLLEGY